MKLACKKCGSEKDLDCFPRHATSKFGRRRTCKLCNAAYTREWTANNPERAQKALADWRLNNKEKVRAYTRTYVDKNRDSVNKRSREWKSRNRDKVYAQVGRRRALKNNALINDFTAEDWALLLEEHNFSCFYCNRSDLPITKDHKTPLSRGGDHTKLNIVPACGPCNYQKNDKTVSEYIQYLSEMVDLIGDDFTQQEDE